MVTQHDSALHESACPLVRALSVNSVVALIAAQNTKDAWWLALPHATVLA